MRAVMVPEKKPAQQVEIGLKQTQSCGFEQILKTCFMTCDTAVLILNTSNEI